MDYIIDMQGFKDSLNNFIFKEVAIIALDEDTIPSVYLFKPPQKWHHLLEKQKSENRWLEHNYHGIPWSSGCIPYENLTNTIQSSLQNAHRVFVKGLEKQRCLKKIFPDLRNLEDWDCPPFRKLYANTYSACTHHTLCKNSVCAAYNVYMLKSWLLDIYRQPSPITLEGIDEVDHSTREKLYSMYN